MTGLIGYRRVSTAKQGESGLGLEAQLEALKSYSKQTGKPLIAVYTEVESGKVSDRPELKKALAHAKRNKACLCVAKLDRLSRNVAFLSAIMDSGADFVACDNPAATRLVLHILIAVAEAEALAISQRTKAALAQVKARYDRGERGTAKGEGKLLGSARPDHWQGREDRREAGAKRGNVISAQVRAEKAREAVSDLLPIVAEARSQGESLQQIANRLNAGGHRTPRGAEWQPMQVKRILDRVG